MKIMALIFTFLLLMSTELMAINITATIQPNGAYLLHNDNPLYIGRTNNAYDSDSTLQPTYWNNNAIASCKGLMATDTGWVFLWLTNNSKKMIYPLKITEYDLYQRIPIVFKKIFKYGPGAVDTTMSLKNIYVFPDEAQ